MVSKDGSDGSSDRQGDFQPIDDPKERQRLLGYAVQSKADVHFRVLEPRDLRALRFEGLSVAALGGSDLVTLASRQPIAANVKTALGQISSGQVKMECLFGLSEGEFVLRGTLTQMGLASIVVKMSAFEKLQRRENFRVSTAAHPTFFSVQKSDLSQCLGTDGARSTSPDQPAASKSRSAETSRIKTERFRLVDLSVGGMRLIWSSALDLPLPECELNGELELHTGSRVSVRAKVIRIHSPKDDSAPQVSLAFDPKSLTQESTRSILFTCTQISRRF